MKLVDNFKSLLVLLLLYTAKPIIALPQDSISDPSNLFFIDSVSDAILLAKHDIDNNSPFILLQGGINPIGFTIDSVFLNKYKVDYYDYGCIGPKRQLIEAYNVVIFKYLDKHFGKSWRKDVRKDAIGVKRHIAGK